MTTDSPMQLGMVGLGRMGAGLVRRLMRDGHSCVVYDVNPAAVEALVADGAVGASSLADLAGLAGRDHVFVWGSPAGRPGAVAPEAGWVWDADGLPSQLCRRLIGESEGDGIWNWQDRILLASPDEYLDLINANLTAAPEALAPLDLRAGAAV